MKILICYKLFIKNTPGYVNGHAFMIIEALTQEHVQKAMDSVMVQSVLGDKRDYDDYTIVSLTVLEG